MGKLFNKRGERRGRETVPTHAADVPLAIDGGGGLVYRVRIVKRLDYGTLVATDHQARTVSVRATDDARELLRRLACAAEAVAHAARRLADEARRFDLHVELCHIAPMVDAATPTRSAVRLAFHNAGLLDDSGSDHYEASLDVLQHARDAFDALTAGERRAILNGWSTDRERPSLAGVQSPCDGDEARRVLALLMSDRHVSADHAYTTQLGGFRDRVCVAIQEGTSKADALRLLGDAVKLIRDAWPVLVDATALPESARRRVPGMVRDGHTLDEAIAGIADADGPAFTLPARVMFDGTTPIEPAMRLLASSGRADVGTQIVTEESIDRHGRPIRVGDVVVECDGGIIATAGAGGAGRVLAVAGSAVIYTLGDGRGYTTATAGDCYVVAAGDAMRAIAAAHENGGASQTPSAPELDGQRSDEAKKATTAAA